MLVPLQITMRQMARSEALDTDIRERVDKLEQFYPGIVSCRVALEQTHKHHRQGKHFEVRIDLRMPRREINVTREHDEDVYVALREAFDAARRQLEDAAREQRGDVKTHPATQSGEVSQIRYAEGFGFIKCADGRELYFSRDHVVHPSFERLAPGVVVHFIEEAAAEGPQAKRVSAGKLRA
jgi:ribosomal subunit interface protein